MTSSELTVDRSHCTPDRAQDTSESILYLAPDCTDSAVKKRVQGLLDLGHQLTTFAFRRDRYNIGQACSWDHVELGKSQERRLLSRLISSGKAVWIIYGQRARWRAATLIWARNLDLALLGLLGKLITGSPAPLVYEVLDIHGLLVQRNARGTLARWWERRVLARCQTLVVSSPEFAKQYFQAWQGYQGSTHVVENKWSPGDAFTRPSSITASVTGETPRWTIGWFGNLRCLESLEILTQVARQLPDRVEIYLRGVASLLGDEVLRRAMERCANIVFEGEYDAPEDLREIYGRVQFNWCVDLSDGLNSRWLIPNRIYEGGYFGVPALAVEGYYTGTLVTERGLGFTLQEASADCLKDLLLSMDADTYQQRQREILKLPVAHFTDACELANVVTACAQARKGLRR